MLATEHLETAQIGPERHILEELSLSWRKLGASSSTTKSGLDSSSRTAPLTHTQMSRRDQFGLSPLPWAVRKGDITTVSALLVAGVDPDVVNSWGSTPLFDAVWSVDVECTKLLLEAGANVHLANTYGDTPVMFAFRSPEILSLLLCYGALPCLPPDSSGWSSPLGYAADFYRDLTDFDETTERWAQSLDLLMSAGLDINSREGPLQRTPLMIALMRRNAPLVKLILEGGAQTASVDGESETLFHYAARWTQVKCIQVLRQASINDIDPDAPNMFGTTAVDIINSRVLQSSKDMKPGERRIEEDELQLFSELIREARQEYADANRRSGPDPNPGRNDSEPKAYFGDHSDDQAALISKADDQNRWIAEEDYYTENSDDTERDEFFDVESENP
jgi:hypothetical protein